MDTEKSSVLITGCNGFIASHIIAQLIEAGYAVTATVRSDAKARQFLEKHPTWQAKLRLRVVPDVANPHAFDHLFDQSYNFIIHTASPVAFEVTDIKRDLIDPAVQGTIGLFSSALKLGGSKLKRIVLLGSAVAILNSFETEGVTGSDYTEDDWNPVTATHAVDRQDAVLGYNASKKLAEQAAWKFMDDNRPAFDLVVINPDIVIGPMLHPVPKASSINETNKFAIYSFLDGTHKSIESVTFPFYHFFDVRDVSKAHVLAMTAPEASNKRILLVSGLITPQLVVNTVRKHFPELRDRLAEGSPDKIYPSGAIPTGWDVSRSYKIFGKEWRYRNLDESLVDTVGDILYHEEQWKSAVPST